MADIVEKFKTQFVEARFTSLLVSIGVLVMRWLLFHFRGIPEYNFPNTGFVWQYFAPYFANPETSFVVGTIFVFLIAILIAHLNNRFSLIRTRTNLPFIVPLFLFSLHPYFLAMSADYVAIMLLLIALSSLFSSYQQPDTQLFSFRSAILIGVAGLFQIYALILLPVWWRGEVSMRGVQVKSFFTSIFGVLLVYLSVFSIYFLYGNVEEFVAPFLNFNRISVHEIPYFTPAKWIGVAFVFVLFGLYMLLSLNISSRVKVLTLSATKFVIWVIALFLILQVIYWNETMFFMSMSIAFASYLVAFYHSIAISKAHVYCAYIVMILLIIFYLLNCFFF
jgi:hypothetical protein